MKRAWLVMVSLVLISGCSNKGISPEVDHATVIQRHTQAADKYNGFYQTFRATVTMLTPEVLTSNLQARAKFLNWPKEELARRQQKALEEAKHSASFFLKFYTPDEDYDDLSRGNSMWKIFLDYGGQRFQASVKKIEDNRAELGVLYPGFDRFSTPYEVTFPLSMTELEKHPCTFIITSSLGQAELSFQPQ